MSTHRIITMPDAIDVRWPDAGTIAYIVRADALGDNWTWDDLLGQAIEQITLPYDEDDAAWEELADDAIDSAGWKRMSPWVTRHGSTVMADVWTQRHADAEALCNLWGVDPNDDSAWAEAWNFAPEWRKDKDNG